MGEREVPIILIVDDEQSARETVAALLQRDSYRMEFANGGVGAIKRLGQEPPVDLILCDLIMPGMDGLEVCRRVKAHPQWRFIPLVLITALDGQDDMVRGLEAGADEFITKPIEKVVLRARVRAMLRVRDHYNQLGNASPDLDRLLRGRREEIVNNARLSVREREVLELLLLGRTHEDIAQALGITARTSKFHQANILQKLGADSRVDLARLFL